MEYKVTALVPCRKGSQRVKNKNVRNFSDGDSLLHIKLRQLINTNEIESIIVSTDDLEVERICREFSSSKIILHKREEYFASSECSNEEFISYFAKELNIEGHLLFTHVTSPFISSKTYSRAIREYFENIEKNDSLVSVKKIQTYLWDKDNKPLNYEPEKGLWPKTQEIDPVYEINSGIFLIDFLLMKKYKDRVGKNPLFFECSYLEDFDIDWEEDFELGSKLWKGLK